MIDDTGHASGGSIQIGGTIDGSGPVLLTGDIVAVGFEEGGGQLMDFVVVVTGGDLAAEFGGFDAQFGIVLDVNTVYSGDWSQSFDNLVDGVKGTGAGLSATASSLAPDAEVVFQPGHDTPADVAAQGVWISATKIRYEGELVDENPHGEPRWNVTWDLTATVPSFSAPAVLSGNVCFENSGFDTTAFTFVLEVPVFPVSQDNHDIGGLCGIELTTDKDGGEISCADGGVPVWRFRVDGDDAAGLFACPFSLMTTGAATLSTNSQFGQPYPSFPGPPLTNRFGLELAFEMTPGERVEFTNLLVIAPQGDSPTPSVSGDGLGTAGESVLAPDTVELVPAVREAEDAVGTGIGGAAHAGERAHHHSASDAAPASSGDRR